MNKNLGMIGLGKMGLALSKQMIADGHTVYGYDIDPDRIKLLQKEGGIPVANAREIAEKSNITFSILLKASLRDFCTSFIASSSGCPLYESHATKQRFIKVLIADL